MLLEARGRLDYIPDGPEEIKEQNLSLLFKFDGQAIGTVRLDQKPDGRAIVRLVAIARDIQRWGHGTALFERLERLARSLGSNELLVHSAPDAVGFYQKLGFSPFEFGAQDIEIAMWRASSDAADPQGVWVPLDRSAFVWPAWGTVGSQI
ncbi:GNAT family N-acetyltransferase [Neorhizobium galegae]|uniref:GNAT family N-acetyltransferase n=1 Tax=Neorhizobium galegae TaxID=399 RepID=UPI002036453D|nr:GNAT family N-acetyltransferase [Neorhizobium galegae]MCM2498700.1 GNAT family N-acetyltransferase [Neorhizobium galegae]